MYFPTQIDAILERMQNIDPVKYANSRNYVDGAVTYLSPYISRGVISTQQVYQEIKKMGLPWGRTEKLIQELVWRDYWQQVWNEKGDAIFLDLKNKQEPVLNYQIPKAILEANTGIIAVDDALEQLFSTGYMHNHMRMYVAAICCNIAKCHWLVPAKWLYSHLLDGDLASNHLSWQWVAGAFANKKYVANQENINKYFKTNQQRTFLDVPYEDLLTMEVPNKLQKTVPFTVNVELPKQKKYSLQNRKTLLYNYYNIDPDWYFGQEVQRVFLLEPSFFKKFPVSQKSLDFALQLTENIHGIQIFVGEFDALLQWVDSKNIVFKQHPTNKHYKGTEESRDWMTTSTGYFPSFFKFWKKAKNEL
ncbi:FAD-binding domain-containing protein [Ochrovirga pacifica]|uniref:FAD-binding domain-containing protein n=1 Tax=Ochrovirga pacifica TaxID=1042376 RepID=UPI0002557FD7|nr:FAD-binding domain-containing protein [Ochrovirga pacifica]